MMLLMHSLIYLLELWSNGSLQAIPVDLIRDEVLVVVFQILIRSLGHQKEDGSWGRQQSLARDASQVYRSART